MVRPRNVNKKRSSRSAPKWETEDVFESRTQLKLAAQEVTELGERLASMKPSELARYPLPDDILAAIEQLRQCKPGPGYKRQKQYLGKLLRGDDELLAAIRATDEALVLEGKRAEARVRVLEQWRARLLEEGDAALADFMAAYPRADRARLRQRLRTAQKHAPESEAAKKAYRDLFQSLKDETELA
jgi:ribosome-associated protein